MSHVSRGGSCRDGFRRGLASIPRGKRGRERSIGCDRRSAPTDYLFLGVALPAASASSPVHKYAPPYFQFERIPLPMLVQDEQLRLIR